MPEQGGEGLGDSDQDFEMNGHGYRLFGLSSAAVLFYGNFIFKRKEQQRWTWESLNANHGDRSHSYQKLLLTRRLNGTILQQWFRSTSPSSKYASTEKKICRRNGGRREVV
ncbi:unnamed protein product [Strongylus vulgaris]|uniref:Uncharacterized protein n=1 Tax=Strongylus vulgaris TaxID=40348 RepID=A0A3P7JDJ8_STRVU|nr:unnamed protein product [Strongylus vulgaris]